MTDIASAGLTADLAKPGPSATSSPTSALAELADLYWQFRCEEFPIDTILAGVTPPSDRLTRDAPSDHERRAAWATQALADLDRIPIEPLSRTDRATHMLLRGE